MTIKISGIIGIDTIPKDVEKSLKDLGGADADFLFSSPGGLVGATLAIRDTIKRYKGRKTATLSGYVMSGASHIVSVFPVEDIKVEDSAVYMLHNASSVVEGDHNEVIGAGEMLKGLSGIMARDYSKQSGRPVEEIAALMDKRPGTFFFGEDIVKAGFAGSMISTETEKDSKSSLATAQLAYATATASMAENSEKFRTDLNRAAAMALGNTDGVSPKKGEEAIMDLKELKDKYPDLVTALRIEEQTAAQIKIDAAASAGKEAGAKAEAERARAVHGLMTAGHEDIVTTAMFDGKSDAGAVAMQIIAAQKAQHTAAAAAFVADAPKAVEEPQGNHDNPPKEGNSEAALKNKWKAMPEPERREYATFELFVGYMTDGMGFEGGAK